MRGKRAKQLRRYAERVTAGEPAYKTRRIYQALKANYKKTRRGR